MSLTKSFNFLIVISALLYSINVNYASIIILISLFILCIFFIKKPIISKQFHDLIWLIYIILFPAVLNLLRTHEYHTYLIIGYFFSGLLYAEYKNKDILYLFYIFNIVALIEAISIYVQFFVSGLYNVIAGVVLGGSLKEILLRQTEGYYTGLTKEVSFTVWFIVVGCAYTISRYFENKDVKKLVLITFYIIALLLSGKKAQPLFFLVSILFIYVIISNKRFRIIKILLSFSFVFGVIYFTYPIWKEFGFLQRFVKLIETFKMGTVLNIHELTTGRDEIYLSAIELWNKNKIFGIGLGNFRFDVPKNVWFSWFDVHNCYLQVLCETGIIGFVIYLGLILYSLFHMLLLLINIRQLSKDETVVSITCSIVVLFFIMYSFTGTCLYEYSYYILFFLCIKYINDVAVRIRRRSQGEKEKYLYH